MTKKRKGNVRLDEALLDIAKSGRGKLVSNATADKITMRVLGEAAPEKPEPLSPNEIRTLRERAGMSQAVFARYLNLTTGYLSQLERGVKQPTGPALALLHVIRRKGMQAIL